MVFVRGYKMNMNYFVKTHGLGNEYIVLDKGKINFDLTQKAIVCFINL